MSCKTDAEMISKYLIPALESDLKLFSFYLSLTLHFKTVWNTVPMTPLLCSTHRLPFDTQPVFPDQNPKLMKLGSHPSRCHKQENSSFVLQPSKEELVPRPTCCVSVGQKPIHGIAFLGAGVKKPTDLLFLLDFSLGLILPKEHFSSSSSPQTMSQARILW